MRAASRAYEKRMNDGIPLFRRCGFHSRRIARSIATA